MKRLASTFTLIITAIAICACNSHKVKPVSDSISKTVVNVNGKKDSVINNPKKNYGNATIADPCVRCLLLAIQADSGYQKKVTALNNIKYVVNYAKTTQPQDTVSEIKATNALRVDIIDKKKGVAKIGTFVYDNSIGKMYSVQKNIKSELKVDPKSLKKIRNGCYWVLLRRGNYLQSK